MRQQKPRFQPTQYEIASDTLQQAVTDLLKPAPAVKLLDYPKFTYLTGGFRPKEFTILCGATGTGKTTLLANLSNSLISQEVPHFVASVETGRHDFIRRIISARVSQDWNTGDAVPLEKIKSYLSESEIQRLNRAKLYLSLYENRFTVEQLIHDIEYMVNTHGVKVAMIDNLNFFMQVKSAGDAIIEMDRVIHELIMFCKRCDVHIIMVMHPKKTDGGRVESEFDIKGSSTSVQEAQNVILFNRPTNQMVADGLANYGDRELLIAKMRRRGSSVGSKLILEALDGVSYREGNLICKNQSQKPTSFDSPSASKSSSVKSQTSTSVHSTPGSTRSTMARGAKQSTDWNEQF
jgi:replicative DNA helicase